MKELQQDIQEIRNRISFSLDNGLYDFVFDGMKVDSVDDVIELVMQWEDTSDNLSFDVGYLRALDLYKDKLGLAPYLRRGLDTALELLTDEQLEEWNATMEEE